MSDPAARSARNAPVAERPPQARPDAWQARETARTRETELKARLEQLKSE